MWVENLVVDQNQVDVVGFGQATKYLPAGGDHYGVEAGGLGGVAGRFATFSVGVGDQHLRHRIDIDRPA